MATHSSILAGKSHGQRSLVGYIVHRFTKSQTRIKRFNTHIHVYIHTLFHYGLLKDIEYSSLCYTTGLYCLSILYVIICIC